MRTLTAILVSKWLKDLCENFAAVFTVQLLIQSRFFKDEMFLFYVRIHCVPRSTHCPPRLHKTNLLMLYEAIVAVCSQIPKQHMNTMWATCRIFEMFNFAVRTVAFWLYIVNNLDIQMNVHHTQRFCLSLTEGSIFLY